MLHVVSSLTLHILHVESGIKHHQTNKHILQGMGIFRFVNTLYKVDPFWGGAKKWEIKYRNSLKK